MLEWLRPGAAEPAVQVGAHTLPLVIRRLPQAKRLSMRLAPDGSAVRISMPRWARTADALEFARSRAEWLERQLAAVPVTVPLAPGSLLPWCGQLLELRHDPAAARRPARAGEVLVIGGPAAALEARARRWLEDEARALLTQDVADYCVRAGIKPARVMLSNAQRRWGSCSAKGAIRINWRLVMAPPWVRRSVAAHEVAHLVHFDHSPRFHALLGDLYEGDIAAANHWLKHQGRGLYRPFG